MAQQYTTLASGLFQPEGPDVLEDSVVFVESLASRVVRWTPNSGLAEVCVTGGGPNAAKVGADGAVYVTQNGGAVPGWESRDARAPSIQRIWSNGLCEELTTAIDGVALQYPNDLAFAANGCLYFTDPPAYLPDHPGIGRIWSIDPEGRGALVVEIEACYPNGIAADPDGSLVWVDSFNRLVYRWTPTAGSRIISQLPFGHVPDGLDIDSEGNLWIATVTSNGIDVLDPQGAEIEFIPLVGQPLNCTFWGANLVVTAGGDGLREAGMLLNVPVGARGAPRFRGAIRR